jgi:serine phosphatase RsbU (regulator of sigma subunit)
MDRSESEIRDLRQVFDAMVDGVMHFDPSGRIVMANRAACRMLGSEPGGRELGELGLAGRLLHRDGSPLPITEYPAVRALSGETVRDHPLLFVMSTGYSASVLSSASPLVDESRVTGAIVSFHDVTSLEAANTLLRETARQSAALVRIGGIVSSTLEVDEIMQASIREMCDAVGAETAAIVMRDGGAWLTRYSYHFPSDIIGVVLSDQEAPHAAMALATRAPVAVDDALHDPRVDSDVMRRYGIQSVLTMPLVVQSQVIGVMFLNHHSAPVAFTPTQIEFTANVATTISLALHNARLFEGQRAVADTLQQAMLTMPERLPGVDFSCVYRSATESARVGGDFYAVFQLSAGRVGIAIGDVSGKGLEAAATAAVVKNTVRAYALAGDPPSEVLRKTNEVMGPALDTGSFVTVLFGVLDPGARTFTYSSAGHPPAVLSGPDHEPSMLREGGVVLGPFHESAYREEVCDVAQRDLLLLYTDGLTEARGNGPRYGEARLLDSLASAPVNSSAEDVVEHLFFDVLDFADGHLSDDLALLAIRLAPEP